MTLHLDPPTHAIPLSDNARFILQERFQRKNLAGESIETPTELFERVASALAAVEDSAEAQAYWRNQFLDVMVNLDFHPATRILANAGTEHPQLANCFVFPLEDSQDAVFATLRDSSVIKSHGGGCGFNYSNIRPQGDPVRGVPGLAVGPVALMKMFDMTTTMFRQQGRYESGNMAVLNVDHPDVFDFITCKQQDGTLSRTNISLGITHAFMRAVANDASWDLVNPRTKEVVRTLPARDIFDAACRSACETGDPGMLFVDHINADNPLRETHGDIVATNPCGEIGLYPYESCNLGYLNLTRFLLPEAERSAEIIFDESRLQSVVKLGVRMIDNAITASEFPISEIDEMVRANRRLGLGVTGWADCLALSGIAYDSRAALRLAERLSETMYSAAFEASVELAQLRGAFPNVDQSTWRDSAEQPRNVALLAFPPSGNNAIIFNTSFAIEPHFALAYAENILDGVRIYHVNEHLLAALEAEGLPTDKLAEQIAANHGSIQALDWIPAHIRQSFKTAHDIAPEWHVYMQVAFQKHVDNAITKTVNLPASASAEDVARIYLLAWELGSKGITVYRDQSRSDQTIEFAKHEQQEPVEDSAELPPVDLFCAHCD